MNMPAVALHDMSVTAPEDVIIWFGIIDILQARAVVADVPLIYPMQTSARCLPYSSRQETPPWTPLRA